MRFSTRSPLGAWSALLLAGQAIQAIPLDLGDTGEDEAPAWSKSFGLVGADIQIVKG